jgi:undecaprenyl-diphosphatase
MTAGLLLYSGSKKGTRSIEEMTWIDAIAIGLFQVLGVLPGVSRSGSTLSGGLIRNFKQNEAAEFAFLLFIPIASGVTLLKVPDYLDTISFDNLGPQIAGLVMSILMTYVALSFLL